MPPLQGIRVVELGVWLAVPMCAAMLGECGATVVKVERVETGGDGLRGWVPVAGQEAYVNYIFEQVNRNKRGVALNLRHPRGREALLRLLEGADVFLTNLRPSSLERLGLHYEALAPRFPRLVYGQVTGYGLRGPERARPAFDSIAFWARSGLMAVHGEPDAPPPLMHSSLGDFATAGFLFGGVVLALYRRRETGRGCLVDTSLLSSGVWVLAQDLLAALFTGRAVPRISRRCPPNPLNNTYRCADGRWLQLSLLQSDRFWPGLCRAIEMPHLEKDPRFATHEDRCRNSTQLVALLDEVFARRGRDEWAERLDRYGLLWGPVQGVEEVLEDPQVQANRYLVPVPRPDGPPFTEVALPFQMDGEPFTPRRSAPEFGEATEEVLLEAGYTWEEISALKDEGAILP